MSLQDDDSPCARRQNYTLEFKLKVAKEYEPGVAGKGEETLARKYGVHRSTVRGWIAQIDALEVRKRDVSIVVLAEVGQDHFCLILKATWLTGSSRATVWGFASRIARSR